MNRGVPLRILPAVDDDDGLVERCVAGDRDARRRLLDREKRRVHATLFRVLGPGPYVEQALKDSFVSAFHSLAAYRGETSLSAWIDRCAVRVALQRLRARSRPLPPGRVPEEGAGPPSTERLVEPREHPRRIYATLAWLPPRERAAFGLCVLDARSVLEAAYLTGATSLVVRARLWRAQRRLVRASHADLPSAAVDPLTDAQWESVGRDVLTRMEAQASGAHAVPTPPQGRGRGLRYATAAVAVAAVAAVGVAYDLGGRRAGALVRLATTQGTSTFTVGDASLLVAPQSLVLVGGDDDRGIDVVVERGQVEVTARGAVVVLRDGEHWTARPPAGFRRAP
ncbi:MAG TPA: RNA polymerase sigma factor [Polyangiaceae bacterium]|nr:RNA polymerase sigma factor [Polyangiaceae bacterium]